ncbi:MAG: hypothetical protein II916_03165 [Oscillospiraceae bacterium]|nr:hypothetical protein [Oscillospiraceae bacterium]
MKKSPVIPLLLSMLLVGGMVLAADLLQEREIIFPEIAAIATGALLTPKLAWRTNGLHTLLFVVLGALLGVAVVWLMPGPLWLQMCVAFLLAQGIFLFSQTGFAPMISAIVLPVLLQTRSWVYVLAALILTALIWTVRVLFVRCGILEDAPFEPKGLPDRTELVNALHRTLTGCILITLAVALKLPYMVAPPLLVAYTEFWKPGAVSRRKPLQVILLLGCCAGAGALLRFGLTITLGVPACIAASLTMLAAFALMRGFSMMLPPAAAISILSFLIPADALWYFPLEIMAGIAVLTALSFFYREEKTQMPLRDAKS